MPPKTFLVERFLQPLRDGEPGLETRFDEERGLNILSDGRALVDVGLDGGTITGTRASGERDDDDRDPEPTTVTMVQAEGYDDHNALAELVRAGTITFTEANAESSDVDDEGEFSPPPVSRRGVLPMAALTGTVTDTAADVERSDVD